MAGTKHPTSAASERMKAWPHVRSHQHRGLAYLKEADLSHHETAMIGGVEIETCKAAPARGVFIAKADSRLELLWQKRAAESEREQKRSFESDLVETAALARQVARLTEQVAVLTNKVDELATRLGTSETPPSYDAVTAWRDQNPEELARYRGMQIAVHPERGIVAYSEDFATLFAEVKRLGLVDQVVFDSVSDQ